MRISDWSSDVCSSDLLRGVDRLAAIGEPRAFTRRAPFVTEIDRGGAAVAALPPLTAIFICPDEMLRVERADGDLISVLGPGRAPPSPVAPNMQRIGDLRRSEEHTSELQALMRNTYAVF